MRDLWDFLLSLGPCQCADRIAYITYPAACSLGPLPSKQFYGSSSTSWCGSRNNLKRRVCFESYVYSTLAYHKENHFVLLFDLV
jgi:hypothetical protein